MYQPEFAEPSWKIVKTFFASVAAWDVFAWVGHAFRSVRVTTGGRSLDGRVVKANGFAAMKHQVSSLRLGRGRTGMAFRTGTGNITVGCPDCDNSRLDYIRLC